MRRAAKVDANQPAIVKELRQLGYKVAITSGIGGDFPDIVVRHPSDQTALRLCEIKDPDKPPSARKLRPGQSDFADEWGQAVILVERIEDVIEGFKPNKVA